MEGKAVQDVSDGIQSHSKERITGTILAAACANSLGGSSIGLSHKDILATTGISGLREFAPGLSRSLLPDHKPGDILSDGYMGLSFAESLISTTGKFDYEDLKKRYAQLLADNAFVKSGPGAQCLASMRRLVDGVEAFGEGEASKHVSGAAPAFVAGCLPGGARSDEAVSAASAFARLMHQDTRVHAAAAVIADSIRFFVGGGKLDTDQDVKDYVKREYDVANAIDPRFAESWDDVAPDLDYSKAAEELPYSLVNVESTVNELVPTAVGIFLIFRHDLEEAICQAARSGGDTDTVAIIVGALSGAYHGAAKIPSKWLNQLAARKRLDEVAQGLITLWG